jgi:hypothetical protein
MFIRNIAAIFIFVISCLAIKGIVFSEEQPPDTAQEKPPMPETPEVAGPPAPATAPLHDIVWIDGILPATSSVAGGWLWDDKVLQDGVISHTNIQYKGIQSHSFKASTPLKINSDSKIIQYLFLDAQSSPSGIMLKLFLNNQELSAYWEGEKEAFVDLDEYLQALYMGLLPSAGEWIKLEIDIKGFGIEQSELEGVDFISRDGKVWWGKTIVTNCN